MSVLNYAINCVFPVVALFLLLFLVSPTSTVFYEFISCSDSNLLSPPDRKVKTKSVFFLHIVYFVWWRRRRRRRKPLQRFDFNAGLNFDLTFLPRSMQLGHDQWQAERTKLIRLKTTDWHGERLRLIFVLAISQSWLTWNKQNNSAIEKSWPVT